MQRGTVQAGGGGVGWGWEGLGEHGRACVAGRGQIELDQADHSSTTCQHAGRQHPATTTA